MNRNDTRAHLRKNCPSAPSNVSRPSPQTIALTANSIPARSANVRWASGRSRATQSPAARRNSFVRSPATSCADAVSDSTRVTARPAQHREPPPRDVREARDSPWSFSPRSSSPGSLARRGLRCSSRKRSPFDGILLRCRDAAVCRDPALLPKSCGSTLILLCLPGFRSLPCRRPRPRSERR